MPYVAPGTRFTAIAAGGDHNLALKSDSTVVARGYNATGASTVPGGLSPVVAVAIWVAMNRRWERTPD
jgi:hypothetical protein